jgi:hypothetical protein
MTMRGTTLGGTTTRAGSGVAAKMTVGTSAPGTPDAARPGAAAIAAGHGTSRFWNEGYYGAGGVARKLSRVVDPSPVLLASDEPVPAATGTGTVRVVDRGFAPGREPAPVDATPTAYREPVRAAPLVVQPSVVASRGAYGPGTFVFRGAGTASGSGSFGGIGTYSGYETWGPVPRFGVAAGCDCR